MKLAALGVLLGVFLLQQMRQLPPLGTLLVLLPLILMAWRWPRLRLLLWIGCGFFWALWRADLLLGPSWPPALMKQDVVITGYIVGIPRAAPHRVRFRFRVDTAAISGRELIAPPRLVRLGWYGRPPPLQPGERWRLRVRLKPPNGFMNPGGFDYEGWLFSQGIRATGYVRFGGARRLPGLSLTPAVWLDRWRNHLAKEISAALPGNPARGVLLALTVGIRNAISRPQWQLFLNTGTNHLLAISGLHIGLIAGLVFWLTRRLWSWAPLLTLRLAAPRAAALAALLAAFLYAALAGFSIPTQRALIMLTVGLGGLLLGRPTQPSQVLSTALLLVLLLDPQGVLSGGFWLSFAAVTVILYVFAGRSRPKGWRGWGRMQWALLLGLLPLTILLFQRVALVAPLANLLAVPWIGLGVVPLALGGMILLSVWSAAGTFLLGLAAWGIEHMWPVLNFLANLPDAHLRLGAASWITVGLGLLGVAWLLAPRGWPARWVGIILVAPLLWPQPDYPRAGSWRLSLLDVGQGMSAVIQTAGHTLVFDAGPRFGSGLDAGAAVVAPYLRSLGLHTVDMLIISHADNDHSGGAKSLLQAFPKMKLLASQPVDGSRAKSCRSGQSWRWDGVQFTMLSPGPHPLAGHNNRSCVLRVSGPGGSVLLLSDIEAAAERRLIRRFGKGIRSTVMIVPHHGSLSSSTGIFLDQVHPRIALLARGFGNRYGFPRQRVMARYSKRGIRVLDTAVNGLITISFSAHHPPRVEPGFRQREGRYWNRKSGP